MTSTDSYRSKARDNFEELKKQYADKNTAEPFWKLGNSFDTMIDALAIIDSSSAHEVARMAVTQFEVSVKNLGGYDQAWFDDFGWWSAASQRALHQPFFAADAAAFGEILQQCWPRFIQNAPFVWQRREPGTFPDYRPAVDGGVWNAYWIGTDPTYPGPKSGDPSSGGLDGIQNTVTNALYLMVAARLGRTDPISRATAETELKFLRTWLDEKEAGLWWEQVGLVRERVGHLHNGAPAPGFQDDWAWAGDQGLILGGYSDYMNNLAPNFRGPFLARAKQLLEGVRQHLVDGQGVVQNYTTSGHAPDGSNYRTGSIVFWRNALHVWTTNDDLRAVLAGQAYQEMVRASADAVMQNPIKDQPLEALTTQTAVLVAATAMLG